MSEDFLKFDHEVSIKEIIISLWEKKLLIIFVTTLFAIASIFISLQIPNKYSSSAIISINNDQSNKAMSSVMSQLDGLSGIAGISMGGAERKDNLILEKFKSRDFLEHILTFGGIKEKLMASDSYDAISKTIIYDEELFNSKNNEWVRDIPKFRNLIPSHIEIYESKKFQDDLQISYNKKNNFITIYFTHFSPVFAHEFISLLINEMDSLTRNKELKESEDAILYLSDMLAKTNEKEIKVLIGRLIESKLKAQMLANVNESFIINIIDPAYVPEMKSQPRRSIIVIMSTIIGFMISSIYALVFRKKIF